MKVTLYALVMLFGAVVAAVGLVLLFRKHEQSLSKVKIFGQEFQFSAPGLVVFIVGAVLLVLLPVLHVDDRNVIVIGSPYLGGGNGKGAAVEGNEQEPNDTFETANLIKFPTIIKGGIGESDRDFFKFQVPSTLGGMPKIRIFLEKEFAASVTVYDNNEQQIAQDSEAGLSAVNLSFEGTSGNYYYILVKGYETGEYKLTVKQEQ